MQRQISPQDPARREGASRAIRRFQAERRLIALRLPGSVYRVACLVLDECDAAGRFRRSQAAICSALSLSLATVKRAFAALRSLGFLRTVYGSRHDVPVCFVQWSDWIAGGVSRLVASVAKRVWRSFPVRGLKPAPLFQLGEEIRGIEERLGRFSGGPSALLIALARRL